MTSSTPTKQIFPGMSLPPLPTPLLIGRCAGRQTGLGLSLVCLCTSPRTTGCVQRERSDLRRRLACVSLASLLSGQGCYRACDRTRIHPCARLTGHSGPSRPTVTVDQAGRAETNNCRLFSPHPIPSAFVNRFIFGWLMCVARSVECGTSPPPPLPPSGMRACPDHAELRRLVGQSQLPFQQPDCYLHRRDPTGSPHHFHATSTLHRTRWAQCLSDFGP